MTDRSPNAPKPNAELEPKAEQAPSEAEKAAELEKKLDEALEMSFPASDPISIGMDDL